MKIGIFDSGIGGLSVLHQAMIIMPEADYIFYADVDNVPYGEKTKESLSTMLLDFLLIRDVRQLCLPAILQQVQQSHI